MSNTNAVLPYIGGNLKELADTIGITQFPSEKSWYQTIGGLLVQGGFIATLAGSTNVISFNAAYPTQVLGVWIQVIGGTGNNAYINAVSLDDFELHNGASNRDYYWWAVGV